VVGLGVGTGVAGRDGYLWCGRTESVCVPASLAETKCERMRSVARCLFVWF